jgi:hypothetical protein
MTMSVKPQRAFQKQFMCIAKATTRTATQKTSPTIIRSSIMNLLKELDENTAEHANRIHAPKLFKTHKPTSKAKTRWNI